MENFAESVKLMLFVYALAAAVSLAVAWAIKLLFAGFQWQKARVAARAAAAAGETAEAE
ncbi:MAG: hypothetical protein QF546_06240 [Alphaproteobacteria bacterium]|jgi:hypothetical protein|nr:hypothetical protein [Alphaproteobacteria bacterium]HJP22391.1 hypothetical protein [Alphaproteobacteria bacterium]